MIKVISRLFRAVLIKLFGSQMVSVFHSEKPVEKPVEKFQISHLFDPISEKQYYESSGFTIKNK